MAAIEPGRGPRPKRWSANAAWAFASIDMGYHSIGMARRRAAELTLDAASELGCSA
jgi:hypothetical protein